MKYPEEQRKKPQKQDHSRKELFLRVEEQLNVRQTLDRKSDAFTFKKLIEGKK